MKNLQIKFILSVLVASALLTGCNALKTMKKKQNTLSYEAKPNPLEVKGDSVEIMVTGKIPVKYFDKKTAVNMNPTLNYEGGSIKLRPITLKGEASTADGLTISKANGGTFTYRDKVAYKPEMKNATVAFNPTALRGSKSLPFDAVTVAEGTLTTALSNQATDIAMIGNDNYAKVVPVEVKGKLLFEIDRAVVRENQKKSAEMKAFEEFIKTNTLTGISISSYASPDGELKRNDQLAAQRTDATYKYFLTWLKKNKIAQVNDSSFYKKSATAEDWDGLKQVAAASDFDDKDQIVNIVSTISDVDAREKEIKKLKSYRKIADKLLPQLRRSEVTLIATEKRKTDEEIVAMSKVDTSKLTIEELLYASTLTQDMNEKMAIYSRVNAQFASDWRGKNNMAYVYLTQGGKANEALAFLKDASALSKDNAIIYNNMGVAYSQLNDYKNAEKNYTLAKSLGAQNNVNLGNLKVRQGDYAAATSYYGSANSCSYNAALAATLAGNYDAAKKNAECAKQDAETFYLKAIIGARTNNMDMLTTNLTRAIRENATLRERATKDMEFKKYMETDAFKVAVR